MKQLLLVMSLSFITIFAAAQSQPVTYHTEDISMGKWDEYLEKYIWKTVEKPESPIKVYIRGNIIMVDDMNQSSYTVTKTIGKKQEILLILFYGMQEMKGGKVAKLN